MKIKSETIVILFMVTLLVTACASNKDYKSSLNSNEIYAFEISNIITSNCDWNYKSTSFNKVVSQEAIVVVSISSKGRIRNIYFEQETDDPAFNLMIENAILKSEPFPPFPNNSMEDPYRVRIRYNLTGKSQSQ